MTKPTLVLLPGLICDTALWSYQARAFEDDFEIFCPNLSDEEDLARLSARVLAGLPARFSLVGHSMGGYVAFEMMRQAPERIERLALIGTSARGETDRQARKRRKLIALSRHGMFKGVTSRLLNDLLHPSRRDDPALARTITEMAARAGREGFISQQKAILSRVDSRDLLKGINCPTLVVCGRDDQMVPPELSTEIANEVPKAEMVWIEDCGHLPPLEKPEMTTDALRVWVDLKD